MTTPFLHIYRIFVMYDDVLLHLYAYISFDFRLVKTRWYMCKWCALGAREGKYGCCINKHIICMCPRKAEVIINIWFAPICEGWYHFKLWPLYSRGLQIRIHKDILERKNPRSGFRSLFLWSNQVSNPIAHVYSVSVWLQWYLWRDQTQATRLVKYIVYVCVPWHGQFWGLEVHTNYLK